MRAQIKDGLIIVAPETDAEAAELAAWRAAHEGHVFALGDRPGRGLALSDLGERAEALGEPINVFHDMPEAHWRPISNLAATPFVLRGRDYASIEGFWQGLKFASEGQRRRVAKLAGHEAMHAGRGQPNEGAFVFDGETIAFGGPAHHELMAEACRAKFSQNDEARAALLSTGERPLAHRMRRDSRTIPGALMADIWMRIRGQLRGGR